MSSTPVAFRAKLPRRRRMGAAVQHGLNTWGRVVVGGLGAIAQVAVVVAAFSFLSNYSSWMILVSALLGTAVSMAIINSRMPMVYKLAWVIPVLLLPLVGACFYLLYGARRIPRRTQAAWEMAQQRATAAMSLVATAPVPEDSDVRVQVSRLAASSDSPLRQDTRTTYYPMGELAFAAMLAAIEAAERYIFVETFIIADGVMFETLFDALRRKAHQGLDVRLMYDDLGSALTVPARLKRRCRRAGIQMHRVNPFTGWFTLRANNRDHRKMLIVDGTIAFTGGTNIADEYINQRERFGLWKDSGLRLEGPGAWGLTVLFLQVWEITTRQHVDYPALVPARVPRFPGSGLVLPYDDGPFTDDYVAEPTYRNMLVRARRSIDIFTPYLVLNDSMTEALCEAAEAGIRVRIVTPGIPDKWYVYSVSRSFYPQLLEKGVEIYEFSPGFIHAKSMVVDDEIAVCGTINFDYRSFYLHQECAVWMHQTEAVAQMVDDVTDTLPRCRRITLEMTRAIPWPVRTGRAVLRTFAPLM